MNCTSCVYKCTWVALNPMGERWTWIVLFFFPLFTIPNHLINFALVTLFNLHQFNHHWVELYAFERFEGFMIAQAHRSYYRAKWNTHSLAHSLASAQIPVYSKNVRFVNVFFSSFNSMHSNPLLCIMYSTYVIFYHNLFNFRRREFCVFCFWYFAFEYIV